MTQTEVIKNKIIWLTWNSIDSTKGAQNTNGTNSREAKIFGVDSILHGTAGQMKYNHDYADLFIVFPVDLEEEHLKNVCFEDVSKEISNKYKKYQAPIFISQ